MAATILAMIGIGIYMTGLDKGDPVRPQLYALHKAIGVTLLVLAVIRLLLYGLLVGQKSLVSGIQFGALFGLAMGISMGFGSYSYMPIPLTLA